MSSTGFLRGARAAGLLLLAGIAGSVRADFANPSTSFGAAHPFASVQSPVGFAVRDFDDDGDADVAFADASGGVFRLFRNDGTASTYDEDVLTVGGPGFVDMSVGLFDAGTSPDFVVTAANSFVVGRNNGVVVSDVTFLLGSPVFLDVRATATHVVLADYNRDGFGDVIVAGSWIDTGVPDGGFVSVYLGDGTTVPGTASATEVLNGPVSALAVGDLNDDGYPEILTGEDLTQSVVVYRNPADGNIDLGFGGRSYGSAALFPRDILIADVTEDGVPDVIVAGSGTYQSGQNSTAFTVLRNRPNDPIVIDYETQIVHSFPAGADLGKLPAGVAVGDVDDDEGPEIVATMPLEDKVLAFHLNNDTSSGTSVFVPGAFRTFPCGDQPYGVLLDDLDGDGELDIVTRNGAAGASAVLFNAAGPGGGGGEIDDGGSDGDPIPEATDLTLKVAGKTPRNAAFQDGKKMTFTCVQTSALRRQRVLVQASATPDVEESWTDIVGGTMTRGRGKKANVHTATVTHVPAGRQFFRTVTSAYGYPDGINTIPGGVSVPPSPANGYIGPYQITPSGSVISMQTEFLSVGLDSGDNVGLAFVLADYPGKTETRTFVGDRLIFRLKVRNEGTEPTGETTVRTQTPFNTDITPDDVFPAGAALTAFPTFTKIVWTVPQIDPGQTKTFFWFATVTDRGNPNGVDLNLTADVTTQGNRVKVVSDPPNGAKIFIPFTSPLTLEVKEVTATPDAGGLMEYELLATNAGAVTIEKCVAWDRLPDGTAYDAAFRSDASGDPVTTTETWGDGRQNPHFDRASRKVFWLLGDLAGGETKRMRLRVRVQDDAAPKSALVNGAYLLQGCAQGSGARCSVLDLSTLQAQSAEPRDVTTRLSAAAPAGAPDLQFSQFAVVPGNGGTASVAAVAATSRIVRTSGSFDTDGFRRGDVVTTFGFTNCANNGNFLVTDVGALELTLATLAGAPAALVDEAADATQSVVNAGKGKVQIGGFGQVAVVQPGGDVLHELYVDNRGSAAARGVRLQGNIAQDTTFVPGSVTVTPIRPAGACYVPNFTLSSGGTLEVDLGTIAANSAVRVEYRFTVSPAAKPLTYIGARNWAVTTDSLSRIHFAAPSILPVYVASTFVPQLILINDLNKVEGGGRVTWTQEVEVGDRVTWTFAIANAGNSAGGNCNFSMQIPKGMAVSDEDGDDGDGVLRVDNAGNIVQKYTDVSTASAISVDLGTLQRGLQGGIRVTLEYLAGKKGATSLKTTATLTGRAAGAKADVPAGTARTDASVAVASPGNTQLVCATVGQLACVSGVDLTGGPLSTLYTLVIANTGSEDALKVEASMRAPVGTSKSDFQFDRGTSGAKYTGTEAVTWKIGTIPAGGAVVRNFTVDVQRDGVPESLLQDSVAVTFANGTVQLPPPTRRFVLFKDRGFDGYRWAASEAVLRGLGVNIEGGVPAELSDAISQAFPASVVTASNLGGLHFCDGTYIAPLSRNSNMVLATGRGIHLRFGAPNPTFNLRTEGINVLVAPAEDVIVDCIPGGSVTSAYALDRCQEYAQAGIANVFAGVTATLVSKRGTTQRTFGTLPDPGTLQIPLGARIDPSKLLAVPGGGIVAAGGGNIVAAGGGNIVAAGGGNIVAAGGGNIVAGGGGNIVAAGGGNIVAGGGGNIVAAGGGNIVAAGGGNLIGQDGAGKK